MRPRSITSTVRLMRTLSIFGTTLKAAVLRHLGQMKEAFAVLDIATKIDPLDVRLMTEREVESPKGTITGKISGHVARSSGHGFGNGG